MIRFLSSLPPHEKKITLSTLLTLARILLVPWIIYTLIHEYWLSAFLLFVAAAVTDTVDGALARWLNEQTRLGAILDPVADKLLLLSSFCTLASIESPFFSIPWWFVSIIIIREVIIVGGAIICISYDNHWRVKPTLLGKIATVMQMCFIAWLFVCYFFQWLPVKTYKVSLGIIVCTEIISLVDYVRIGAMQLRAAQDSKKESKK